MNHTESRLTNDVITGLILKGSVPVTIQYGDVASLTVIADNAEDIRKVKTSVEGSILVVSSHGNSLNSVSFAGMNITINGIDIFSNVSGSSGKVEVRMVVKIPIEDITVQGSGDVTYLNVLQDRLSLIVQGSGDIIVSGEVISLNANVQGSGDIRAKKLKSADASLTVVGSGDIGSTVQNNVVAMVVGSGDIDVYGSSKKRSVNVVGSGDITFHD
jgi:carbon monoxide dehydrogenase subunit G